MKTGELVTIDKTITIGGLGRWILCASGQRSGVGVYAFIQYYARTIIEDDSMVEEHCVVDYPVGQFHGASEVEVLYYGRDLDEAAEAYEAAAGKPLKIGD